MSILLEAEHLTKTFTQRGKNPLKAVKDVSFTLKKGETLGIVGESGSGKSTIAKLLTRLTDITEGTLKFEGKDITRLKQSQLKEVYGDIQMVFQNPVGSFDPRRTLGDGIGESLRNRGMKKADVEKRVAELLEQCGLEKEYAKRYPHEVSGGQCQRAAIARALAVKPKVLISKVNALLQLSTQVSESQSKVLELGDLIIDKDNFKVTKAGENLLLPKKEFDLLYLLASNSQKVFKREEILDKVWGNDVIVGERTIDVHIRRLREKLGDDSIQTLKGIGYKLTV